ncbi:GNAT family N-acetyltransferase [Pantoea ananatis]|uniref:GNAT family N-acetyltransferase n=1 Tax=Pantoea ananas TaxID=553 RepID=UPI00105A59EC|nr:GNAT family N-acetyltransferase [Pantoea ananatis]TDL55215.1 GNAT family N-acetyltransferase [Pantoea ananatis]
MSNLIPSRYPVMIPDTQPQPLLRPIVADDNPHIARVIRDVSAEFGLTADKGYTVADPNLDQLYELYSAGHSAYWIVEHQGKVMGGGGIAPLACSAPDICELQKMYFLPGIRGLGVARELALLAMAHARQRGFRRCYLETTGSLTRAIKLYESLGFARIDYALGCTGHGDCEFRMLKTL